MLNKLSQQDAEKFFLTEMEEMFKRIPYTREFHTGHSTHLEYYKRHVVEIILRIKLNNEVDAYSLYKIGYRDNLLSKKLATYLSEEYGHEAFFMNDLIAMGLTEKQVNDTEPFFATKKLIGYIYYSIMQDGAMPTMVWNWLVELYSDTYNSIITNKFGQEYGKEKVQGSLKHLAFDEKHDHLSLMFSTVLATAKKPEDVEKIKMYITNFVSLIGDYYQELHDSTITNTEKKYVMAS